MIKVKLLILLLFCYCPNLLAQSVNSNDEISDFEVHFKPLKYPFLVDDITVKYSKNKVLGYKTIKRFIKDTSGKVLIVLVNENFHEFKAIGFNKINDSITYYIFSHKSTINKIEFDYSAHLAIFNKNKLVDFRTIYSNSNIESNKNYGSVILYDKFVFFESQKNDFEYYKIDNNGFVFEDDKNMDISDIIFKRDMNYKIEFNSKFYKQEKVLLPLIKIYGQKPSLLLATIANVDLKLEKSFFIDSYKTNKFTEFIYLNVLQSKNDIDFKNTCEVIKNTYGSDGEWLKNESLSDFFIMPNNFEVIDTYTLIGNPLRKVFNE
jgi:hypothetical protein